MGTLRPDRHPSDRHFGLLFDVADVVLGLTRQVAELANAGDVGFPTGQLLVDGLAVIEDRLERWKLLELALGGAIAGGNLDGVEGRQDVELCEE